MTAAILLFLILYFTAVWSCIWAYFFQRVAVLHLEERCERAIQWALEAEPSIKHLVCEMQFYLVCMYFHMHLHTHIYREVYACFHVCHRHMFWSSFSINAMPSSIQHTMWYMNLRSLLVFTLLFSRSSPEVWHQINMSGLSLIRLLRRVTSNLYALHQVSVLTMVCCICIDFRNPWLTLSYWLAITVYFLSFA